MRSRSDEVALSDMHRALRLLDHLVAQHTEESFVSDPNATAAASMFLLTIGESANKLSLEAQAAAPEAPWRKIIDLRHRLAHGYFQQDERMLWKTAINDAPILQRSLPGGESWGVD